MPVDKQHYKKKYLLRKVEEGEAKRIIYDTTHNYRREEEESIQMPEVQQLDREN